MIKKNTLFLALAITTSSIFIACESNSIAPVASNVITYKATKKLHETTDSDYSKTRNNLRPGIRMGLHTHGFHTDAFNVPIISHTFSVVKGTITFSGEVTTIGDQAFLRCINMTSVSIPNSVTSIRGSAFSGCSDLKSFTIPNSVISIGDGAFRECSSLASITIPNSVTSIGNYAFLVCTNLNNVTVKWTDAKQLPTLGEGVFSHIAQQNGPAAATLHVPKGTKSIYEAANQWKDFGRIIDDVRINNKH